MKPPPPRVGDPRVDFLLAVNRLLEAAEDTRRCRDELLEASLPDAGGDHGTAGREVEARAGT